MRLNTSNKGNVSFASFFFKPCKADSSISGNAINHAIDHVLCSEHVIDGKFSIRFHTKSSGYIQRPCDSIDFNPSYRDAMLELIDLFKQAEVIQANESVNIILDGLQYSGSVGFEPMQLIRLEISLELNKISCDFSQANENDRLNAISYFHNKFPLIQIMEERPSVTCSVC